MYAVVVSGRWTLGCARRRLTVWPRSLLGWPGSGHYDWVPRVMSGLAAVLLAYESRLSLSQRWRFHIEMRGAYESILDDIALLPSAEPERSQALDAVRERLDTTRKNEGGVPGGVPQVKRDG